MTELSAAPATIIVNFIYLFVLVLLFMGRTESHYLENQTNYIKSRSVLHSDKLWLKVCISNVQTQNAKV